jgi:aarF domain-containing kinase
VLIDYRVIDLGTASSVQARMQIDDRETTELILDIVAVADRNGLKLPREFGILLKQVYFVFGLLAMSIYPRFMCITIIYHQALYFDRYQKLLAPEFDPFRDPRVRVSMQEELQIEKGKKPPINRGPVIDTEVIDV